MDARKKLAAVLIALTFFAADRLLKIHALGAPPVSDGASSAFGPALGYFLNEGLLFSSFGRTTATIASALAFAGLAAFALLRKRGGAEPDAQSLAAFCLIALGGASNIFDRFRYGGVVDYILFARSAWNIADIMILAGLAITLLRAKRA